MPGGRPKNIAHGDRAEYLAHYLLSLIGLPTPVPRQSDLGIDFYSNIAVKEYGDGKIVSYAHPFGIQIKKLSKIVDNKIEYGGNNKSGEPKEYEIEWLLNQELPFYIGIVEIESFSLRIYSTASLMYLKYQHITPWKITLIPRLDMNKDKVHPPKIDTSITSSGASQSAYIVDLGPPICQVFIDDDQDEQKIDKTKNILITNILRIDSRNLLQKKLNTPFYWWNKDVYTDEIGWNLVRGTNEFEIDKTKEELVPMTIALLINATYGDDDRYSDLLLRLFDFLNSKWPNELYDLRDEYISNHS